jgi:hypothetical protein
VPDHENEEEDKVVKKSLEGSIVIGTETMDTDLANRIKDESNTKSQRESPKLDNKMKEVKPNINGYTAQDVLHSFEASN